MLIDEDGTPLLKTKKRLGSGLVNHIFTLANQNAPSPFCAIINNIVTILFVTNYSSVMLLTSSDLQLWNEVEITKVLLSHSNNPQRYSVSHLVPCVINPNFMQAVIFNGTSNIVGIWSSGTKKPNEGYDYRTVLSTVPYYDSYFHLMCSNLIEHCASVQKEKLQCFSLDIHGHIHCINFRSKMRTRDITAKLEEKESCEFEWMQK